MPRDFAFYAIRTKKRGLRPAGNHLGDNEPTREVSKLLRCMEHLLEVGRIFFPQIREVLCREPNYQECAGNDVVGLTVLV